MEASFVQCVEELNKIIFGELCDPTWSNSPIWACLQLGNLIPSILVWFGGIYFPFSDTPLNIISFE